jgi:hypothetical protein
VMLQFLAIKSAGDYNRFCHVLFNSTLIQLTAIQRTTIQRY